MCKDQKGVNPQEGGELLLGGGGKAGPADAQAGQSLWDPNPDAKGQRWGVKALVESPL